MHILSNTVAINIFAKIKNHPFRLLLYLEWILLVITILVEFCRVDFRFSPPPPINFSFNIPLLCLTIATFGIMGIILPTGNQLSKLMYTYLELLIILLMSMVGGRGIGFSPSLLLILVIRSCLRFQLPGRLLIASTALICFVFSITMHTAPLHLPPRKIIVEQNVIWNLTINSAILFTLVLAFLLLLVNALLAERQSREELAIAHNKLRKYALRIEDQATLQERNRIAREIHDSLGHSLTALSIQLENALLFLESNINEAKEFLLSAKQLNTNALSEVRQSVTKLRSDPLEGKSLESAIASSLENFRHRTNINPKYSLELLQPLSTEVSQTIYRIIQEALTNVYKHSQASEVKIEIQAITDFVYLKIEDNGKGFNPKHNSTGFGLQGMRERTIALGGQFRVISTPKGGCQIMALFPL